MASHINDSQKQAIEHLDSPMLIVAGAGTGKTTTLVEKIHHIVSESRARPDEILALTFTEKAASEMEQRVDEKLPYGYSQTLISTFHSYADSVLRSEGIHVGLNPTYRLMSEAETISYVKQRLFSFNLTRFRPLGVQRCSDLTLEVFEAHPGGVNEEDVLAQLSVGC